MQSRLPQVLHRRSSGWRDLQPRGPVFVFLIEAARVIQMTDDVDSVTPSGTALGLDDLTVDAFDDLGRSLGRISLATVLE